MDMARLKQAVDEARAPAAPAPLPGIPVRRADVGRWHPGEGVGLHCEIFAADDEAGGAGLALAFAGLMLDRADLPGSAGQNGGGAGEAKSVLWIQDRQAVARNGRPYRPGLPLHLRHRLIHVLAQSAQDALFAIEEGLRCRDLVCVIGEIAGNPRPLDFVASRRFSLTAERHGVPLLLIRLGARPELSAARMRWQVRSAPSPRPLWNSAAPGRATWHGELFRARGHAPGQWRLGDDQRDGEQGWGSGALIADEVRAAEAPAPCPAPD